MTLSITPDHWIKEAIREPVAGGSLMEVRRALVIHFTAGASALSSIEFWRTRAAEGASAHIVIDRDGTIYQCRPFSKTCGHAGQPGRSRWKDPKTGRRFDGLNTCTIGIELANAGDGKIITWARKQPEFAGTLKAKHPNGGRVAEWERYPEAQVAACTAVSQLLVERYNLDDVTGHENVAPERKNDPGPAFGMAALREACGFAGLPVTHR